MGKTASKFDLFDISTDIEKRDTGAWIDAPKPAKGLRLKVKGFESPDVKQLQIELEQSRPDDYDTDDEVKENRNRFENRELCKAGLIGWEPFDINGDETPFSEEKRDDLLDDPRFSNFVMCVRIAMTMADDVRLEKVKKTEKNSGTGSAKRSKGPQPVQEQEAA